jgi:hypothetical protein
MKIYFAREKFAVAFSKVISTNAFHGLTTLFLAERNEGEGKTALPM